MAESAQKTIRRLERAKASLQKELDRKEKESKEEDEQDKKEKKKHRKKSHSLHLFPILVLTLALILYCGFQDVMWSGAIEMPSTSYADPSHSQSLFVTQYLNYTGDITGDNGGTERKPIDTAGWYVDANTMSQIPGNEVAQGVVVSLNSPNIPVTDTAYILNMAKPYTMLYDDLIAVEKEFGSTYAYKDTSEYVKEQLRVSKVFGRQSDDRDHLCGSVGPAIMMRDYFDNFSDKIYADGRMWTPHGSTWHNSGRYWDPVDINIMFVKPEDYDKYQSGEQVDVYYVKFEVRDAKAHTAPWGFCQTYCELGSNEVAGAMSYQGPNNNWSRNGTVHQEGTDTQRTMLKKLWQSASSPGAVRPYYWGHVGIDPIDDTATTGALPRDSYGAFEYMSQTAVDAVAQWAKEVSGGDTMYCVGVFVSEYNP